MRLRRADGPRPLIRSFTAAPAARTLVSARRTLVRLHPPLCALRPWASGQVSTRVCNMRTRLRTSKGHLKDCKTGCKGPCCHSRSSEHANRHSLFTGQTLERAGRLLRMVETEKTRVLASEGSQPVSRPHSGQTHLLCPGRLSLVCEGGRRPGPGPGPTQSPDSSSGQRLG